MLRRILARIMPIMLENNSELCLNLCWQRNNESKTTVVIDKEESKTIGDGSETSTIGDESESKETSDTNTDKPELPAFKPAPVVEEGGEPLGVVLVNSVLHLLFLPDFTIEDPQIDFNNPNVSYTQEFKNALMWAPGVGSAEKSVVSSSEYDMNRIDVLRLMIATFSDSLYQNPDTYDSCASVWLEEVTAIDTPYVEIVFYSLINTVLGTYID